MDKRNYYCHDTKLAIRNIDFAPKKIDILNNKYTHYLIMEQEATSGWFEPVPSVRIYKSSIPMAGTGHLAMFDLDWTLIRLIYRTSKQGPRDANDYDILPGRREALQQLIDRGYNLVGVTNQGWKSLEQREIALARIENFVRDLNMPIVIFVALAGKGNDPYRKPAPKMWEFIRGVFGHIESAFYIGDAAGRHVPKDFDDADIRWAENVTKHTQENPIVPFDVPENFFPHIVPPIPGDSPLGGAGDGGKVLIVFVGEPGSGKSTFYEKYLKPKGFAHISQDIVKTRENALKLIEQSMIADEPIVIDNTNPDQAKRQEYYDMARRHEYAVIVYYFVRNGEAWNETRTGKKKVPAVAFGVYHRDLTPPTPANTPGPVYQVW